MDLKDKNLSLQFYDYLSNIVGSEEVVKTRREIFTAKDIVGNSTHTTFISSGSRSEGIDLKGSDYDEMGLANYIRVFESLNDVQYYPCKLLSVMETNDTKPGFTKLKLVKKSDFNTGYTIKNFCEIVGEELYISSKRYREHGLSDNMVIHGPCRSLVGGEYDFAVCLRCQKWITPAQQWIHRSRTAWPDSMLVTAAVQYGVLFVPIGCKDSPNENLQWRISFSATEKLLIHSFSHTQLLCYALMKILLKDLIKPRHGDLLCSYFIKTIMFWLSEEIDPSAWKPENMISCVLDCITRLIYCVEYKTCLHYFISENNLFEDRFTDNERKSLLNTLRFIYESPWISVFETSTFQNYRFESVKSHGMVLSASELSSYRILDIMVVSKSMYSAVQRLTNVCSKKDICTCILSAYASNVLQSSNFCYMLAGNKSFYEQFKRSLCYFKISLRSLSISSWLLLASLFYKFKQFQYCLVIINYCLSRCTSDMIYASLTNSLAEQTVFKEIKHRYGLLNAMKYLIIYTVSFRTPFCLLPDELKPFIAKQRLSFPPVVFSYLLQFLCFYQLGDDRGKHNALHDLELTIRKRFFIFPNRANLRKVHKCLEIVRALL
ncbi:Hypothetical predicted protein [Mytilus galloprovincialis]|uniref:Mab-21-like HhH/H2TH-like domain-containing protein n=1 Tax=Mytilus galloprovincialis TaxID=29158 RepID=A0A8B6C8N4_MYTGA|nr:Hypothetical predicted protein [Mytilus galloprovincialis]